MILWLDHLIFGNGHGLATPYFDGRFYWLSGRLYTFSGGLGAQLTSYEWRHPKAHERRILCGREFKPFHSRRSWLRVRISWAWVDLPRDLNAANEALRELADEIGREHYGERMATGRHSWGERDASASGIEARRAETRSGSGEAESPVGREPETP